ncbi:MAG: transglycosylase SLT domain-containing protein [Candidatus Thioglobus sp.]|jgi:hypothetical protein|nr:transglycosylase SLT domain-containing protein [Candidatus Thioglobus sp.]|tara:strand:+ start:322 stop:930 length:609 start_codon:yes stop_codon:yes gene_type:complete
MKNLIGLSLALLLVLSGCFSTPAREVTNICHLLDEKVSWYQAAKKSEAKWLVPMHLQLAIIYQESHFSSNAKPPRNKIFGVIPGLRSSSSYGFTQAKKETWEWYQLKTGNNLASRSNFADSIDFVGWYVNQSEKRSNISRTDAYNQYLAYHEGQNGFNNKTYQKKPWLLEIANKVNNKSNDYKRQLSQCRAQLDSNRVWSFF